MIQLDRTGMRVPDYLIVNGQGASKGGVVVGSINGASSAVDMITPVTWRDGTTRVPPDTRARTWLRA